MQTILVVDDSQVDRRLVGGMLQKTGEYQVVYAEDGEDALTRLELDVPDLVLTDLNMPKMDGQELVKAIRANYSLIPVILMTAVGSEELAVSALRIGAASYVPKRRLSDELIDTVSHVLSLASFDRGQTRLRNRIVQTRTLYTLPNDSSLVQALAEQIRETLRCMRIFPNNERLRIGIAVEEALLNALYHGNLEVSSELRGEDHSGFEELARERAQQQPWSARSIHVEVHLSQDEARFQITDQGTGFDPSSIPDPTDPEFLERPSGRGMLLMQSFMDTVSYNDNGTQVTMIKQVPVPEPAGVREDDE